ncbi:TerD family protein [Streptomyces sp. NPDC057694]|uniref:TerD family protein n=1 Tax=Streptomyces sp. NPDC057694 TaxID=3346216 RepID=UPI0036AEBECE
MHLQTFPALQPPVIGPPPELGLAWARSEAQAFHLQGIGRLARSERSAAKTRAAQDAPGYLAAEQARLHSVFEVVRGEADRWWHSLLANNEETVCEAVNTAFSDNPAAGCAVGVDGSVMSVVMRQQDLDALPDQAPGLTPNGRPTLKRLSKRERTLWWLTSMGSNIVATLKEGFATAPSITAIDLAVLTRLPDSQRLGFVAFGRWSRHAVDTTPWRDAQDALRFLDIGQDVACSVKTTASGNLSSVLKPLDVSRTRGLQVLLDHLQEETDTPEANLSDLDVTLQTRGADDGQSQPLTVQQTPYEIRPFAEWKAQTTPPVTPSPPTAGRPHQQPRTPATLVPGQTVVLPEEAWQGLHVAFTFAGADADLTLLLTDADSQVAQDEDFVFYNQPTAANGAARLLGKQSLPSHIQERATLHLSALPPHVHRIIVSINMDVDTRLPCSALTHASLHIECDSAAWTFQPPADPTIRAMVIAEIYRHHAQGTPIWKLRAIGQGWADGLDGLARAYGVDVE